MGQKIVLDIPEDIYKSLLEIAEQTGQTPEELAIQQLIAATQKQVDDPLEQFIGAFNSNIPGWTEQHDRYLGRSHQDTTERD
ncbi:hypothetical protein [Chroococcidiopsis sp.]|uniref:hypothetical protein n=1 Tax=Chroococcidiopsis sp. TaxID=3088168 RepID=UPI003F37F445